MSFGKVFQILVAAILKALSTSVFFILHYSPQVTSPGPT